METNTTTGVVLTATPSEIQIVRQAALLRTAGHDHCRKPSEDRGVAGRNRYSDFYGALGEVLVVNALMCQGLQPDDYELLSNRAERRPDFRLGRYTFDVKSVPPSCHYLTVSEAQRTDQRFKGVYILPVVFTSNSVAQVMRPVSFASTAQWELRQGHSPYRSIAVNKLKPLHDLNILDTSRPTV